MHKIFYLPILISVTLMAPGAFGSPIDNVGIGYYIKGYVNEDIERYYPSGLEISADKTLPFLGYLSIEGRYRYLTTRFKLENYYDTQAHQVGGRIEVQVFRGSTTSFNLAGDLEYEHEKILASNFSDSEEYTYSVGITANSTISKKSETEFELAYRKSTLKDYDQDITLTAAWNVNLTDRLSIKPLLSSTFDFDTFAASTKLLYKF
jgi:hypothetical protein